MQRPTHRQTCHVFSVTFFKVWKLLGEQVWGIENKLKCSEDGKRWWDERSDEYKLKWSEDKQKWWDERSDEYKLEWSEDGKRRWDD